MDPVLCAFDRLLTFTTQDISHDYHYGRILGTCSEGIEVIALVKSHNEDSERVKRSDKGLIELSKDVEYDIEAKICMICEVYDARMNANGYFTIA